MFQTGPSKNLKVDASKIKKSKWFKGQNLDGNKETGTEFKTTKKDLKFNRFLKLVTDHNCFSDSCLFRIDIH